MSSEKLTICVHKLLCPADQSDLLRELSKSIEQRRKSRVKPTYSKVVPSHISWPQLQALIDTKVSLGGFDADIEYIDDEGDCVGVSCDDELREAVKVGLKSEAQELRLLLYHYKRKSQSAEMLRKNSKEKLEKKPLIHLQPAMKLGAIYDSESGEKSPQITADQAPKWFLSYMERFKTELVQDVSDRVTRKTVKRLAHAVPELMEMKNKEKTKDGGKKATCHDAICDVCEKPIIGVRYKCGNCNDFDVCEKCEADEFVHDPDHVFLKMRRPAHFFGKRKGRIAPLLKKSIYYVDPMKEMRRIARMPIVDPIDLSEKYARRHHHDKRTEKLKRRHETQRDAPYKREKLGLGLGSWLRAQDGPAKLLELDVGFGLCRYKESYGCCFVRDESIPDETRLPPGTRFIKKWLVRNTGLSIWDQSVEFVLLWGALPCVNPSAGRRQVPFLSPQEEATLCVEMEAPQEPGTYQSTWSLQHFGRCFGHRVWCHIIVDAGAPLPSEDDSAGTPLVEGAFTEPRADKTEYEMVESSTEKNEESGEVCIISRNNDDDNDEQISYEIVKNEEELLKVPISKASQTATPNNTPLVSSPPKSPAPELELAARKLVSASTSLDAVAERCEQQCNQETAAMVQREMARLTIKDTHQLDIESYSEDSDSESEYFVVPLPQCFDVSTPLTRSTTDSTVVADVHQDSDECSSEKSFDLVSHASQEHERKETALKLGYDLAEEQPEIELQDLSERRPNEIDIQLEYVDDFSDDNAENTTEIIDLDAEPSFDALDLCEVAETGPLVEYKCIAVDERDECSLQAEVGVLNTRPLVAEMVIVKNQDSGEEDRCTEHTERILVAPVPPEMHLVQETTEELDLDQTMVKRPVELCVEPEISPERVDVTEIRSCENGEIIHDADKTSNPNSQSQRSSPGIEDFMNAAFVAAGSAASHAIHAAKDVVSMLKQRNQYIPPRSTWAPPSQPYVHQPPQWTSSDDAYSDVSDDENVYPIARDPQPPRDLTAMETLLDMGFANREVNERLLKLYDNDINKVVTEILSSEGSWPTERH